MIIRLPRCPRFGSQDIYIYKKSGAADVGDNSTVK